MPNYAFNSGYSGGGTAVSNYGEGSGGIQQYGYTNPYGPYSAMAGLATNSPYGNNGGGGNSGDSTGGDNKGSGGDDAARKYLSGVVSGSNTPYNSTTRNSMYSQQAGMAGAAEAGRNQQIAEQGAIGGASPTDPSYQRMIRQSMAQRQSQNQQSMGDIDRTANIANQQSQQQAAGTLLNSDDERYALQQGYNQRATQMAMGYLYGSGGGGGQSSGPNNFNLGQEQRQQTIGQSADDAAWAQAERRRYDQVYGNQ